MSLGAIISKQYTRRGRRQVETKQVTRAKLRPQNFINPIAIRSSEQVHHLELLFEECYRAIQV